MSATNVEMKVVPAYKLERNDVFEMFGNLYQVDFAQNGDFKVEIHAHLIAQIDTPRGFPGATAIFVDPRTPIQIEA